MASKPTKKTSMSSEIVFGKAAQQINKAVTELAGATTTINNLVSQVENLTLEISNQEAKISELEIEYKEKARQAEVDFNLSLRSNQESVVKDILKNNNMEAISTTELNNLRKELETIKNERENEIKKQVASVTNSMKIQFENDLRFIQAENKAITAESISKIESLLEKNKFLEEQVTKLYGQLDAERSAGIERAKAGSIGNIVVGDTNRK